MLYCPLVEVMRIYLVVCLLYRCQRVTEPLTDTSPFKSSPVWSSQV